MDSRAAAHQLEIIRTLMERAALYRRALAPIGLVVGVLGCLAGALGWLANLSELRVFGYYWMGVAGVGLAAALLMVRRQALRDREPFWSPAARRVGQALFPALVVGGFVGLVAVWPGGRDPLRLWWLPPIWMVIYGCALHAAGFWLSRGIKWLGWLFLGTGCLGLWLLNGQDLTGLPDLRHAHGLMAATFGGFHLAYGLYLHFTENRANAT